MLSSIWLRIKNHWVFNWYIELNQIKLQILACFTAKLWELGRKWGDWWWEVKSLHVAIAVVTTVKRLLLLPTIRTQIYLFPTDKADFSCQKKSCLFNFLILLLTIFHYACLCYLQIIYQWLRKITTKLFAISWLKMENWKMSSWLI